MALALVAAVIAISHQSFWIDEASAALKASHASIAQWWQAMRSDGGSDVQMPFYMLALWGWERLVGPSEWALRAMNVLWLLPGLYFFACDKVERWLVASASAFIWYCLDEARPYAMQIGASLLIFGLVERALISARDEAADVPVLRVSEKWLLALGFVVLAGSSLLGAIWAGAAIGAAGLAAWKYRRRLRASRLMGPIVVFVGPLAALCFYYGWTLEQGARASTVGRTDVRSLVFIAYELMGFAGLGPGRMELRAGGLSSIPPYVVPLAFLAAAAGAIVVAGAAYILRRSDRRILLACVVMLGGAAVFLFAVGCIKEFRILGRHFAPLLPLLLAVQAAGLAVLWRRRSGKVVALMFLVLALGSALSFRFAPRHAKDDYRSAAAAAQAALKRGERVWWNADTSGALLYGVPLGRSSDSAFMLFNPEEGFATHAPRPTTVIASKPDIYDSHGALADYLEDNRFQPVASFPAFEVWKHPQP
jgi:hypothetical protein